MLVIQHLFCFFLFEKVIITERIFTKEISENKLTKIIKMVKTTTYHVKICK